MAYPQETAAYPGVGAPAAPVQAAGGGWAVRAFKFVLALLLLPACAGFSLGCYEHFWTCSRRVRVELLGWPEALQFFACGAGAFAVLAVLFWRPVVVYLFAHELVHALATWLCLGRVSNLQLSASGGQVTTSKSNTFIRLAPYFIPLYALGAALLFFALDAWWRPLGAWHWTLCAALGFAMAFHLSFTLWSLKRDQPDLKPDGGLFSLVVIYLANVAVLAAVLGLVLSGQPRGAWDGLSGTARAGCARSVEVYEHLAAFARDAAGRR